MRPFFAPWAREVSGKPIRYAEERAQKLDLQNFRNSRFVRPGLEDPSCFGRISLSLGLPIVDFLVSLSSDAHAIKLIGSGSVVNTSLLGLPDGPLEERNREQRYLYKNSARE
jgi:hypothetical protein